MKLYGLLTAFCRRTPLALIAAAIVSSCTTDAPAGSPTRETLPNGATLVRYPGLPAIDSVGPDVTEARIDLQFGSVEGEDLNFIFGDIRGIQAAGDGTIYVLDNQALEVRVFSPEGEYLRTIMRRGEGPGEILRSNGFILSGDTLLWVHETTKYVVIGVDAHGEEVRRFDAPLRRRGYFWDGAFDLRGRYWRSTSVCDDEELDPEPGLLAGSCRRHYVSYDLAIEVIDSVYLGEETYRSFMARMPGDGRRFYTIPFQSSRLTLLNPSGGFWDANKGSYRLTRTAEGGDTLLVIEASLPPIPVTAEDRSAYVQAQIERSPEMRSAVEEVAALMPYFKPILEDGFVDDEERLWVQRSTPLGAPRFYDLFSGDGNHLGSIRFAFQPAPYSPLWVRHGHIYALVLDDLDVQYVVRAPIS
ncbi:MAG: 6-bladed beta-propeller [Gemmatimonadota bacterium]|nr:6-bladed beta-propeller [Gemmatimonadota bacterium]